MTGNGRRSTSPFSSFPNPASVQVQRLLHPKHTVLSLLPSLSLSDKLPFISPHPIPHTSWLGIVRRGSRWGGEREPLLSLARPLNAPHTPIAHKPAPGPVGVAFLHERVYPGKPVKFSWRPWVEAEEEEALYHKAQRKRISIYHLSLYLWGYKGCYKNNNNHFPLLSRLEKARSLSSSQKRIMIFNRNWEKGDGQHG